MKNVRFFEIIYKGPTERSGSRVLIRDLRHEKRRILSYDYSYNSITDQAIEYLEKKGIAIVYKGESIKGYLLCSENFDIQI